jgi:hypothetical protein
VAPHSLVDGDDFDVSVLYGISEDNSTDSTETDAQTG